MANDMLPPDDLMVDVPVRRPALDQTHFFADPDAVVLGEVDQLDTTRASSSFWADAWRGLRRRPLFWISAALILLLLVVSFFPTLFTGEDPRYCDLSRSLGPSESGHPLGFDKQGCDVFARLIWGTRTSVEVGFFSALFTALIGTVVGLVAGYYGGWLDTILARITDIFFAIPTILAAIVVMQVFRGHATAMSIVLVISLFAWVSVARIARGAAISVRNADFITASKALGVSRLKIMVRHVLPNSLAPIIVTATTQLGTFIVLEATLSFLGLGLPPSVMSWGNDISTAQSLLRTQPEILFYPAGALALTVLAFIMLGDAVRDALDPKAASR
jgi:oligopeptide transport system permease protein